jgi:hypothetical protein
LSRFSPEFRKVLQKRYMHARAHTMLRGEKKPVAGRLAAMRAGERNGVIDGCRTIPEHQIHGVGMDTLPDVPRDLSGI